ncbi:30S ribosomal protein S12 methylthiotransferase RimO [Gemmatimonadota bacterium]
MNPTIAFVTLGCAKNSVDSEKAMGALVSDGFSLTSDPASADVVIINTCGFIEPAREESIDEILQIAELKKTGRLRSLIVGGCFVARNRDELKAELPEVDRFLGLLDPLEVRAVCRETAAQFAGGDDIAGQERYDGADGLLDIPRVLSTPGHYAWLKIAEGCSNACSFCTIPLIRGASVSVEPDDLITESAALARSGVKELILIAQDTTLYGYDLKGGPGETGIGIAGLLRRLDTEVEGIEWMRLMYAYPSRVTGDLLDVMASSSRIVPYLDLPVQSGSDRILKAMKRGMGRTATIELLHRIRESVPGITLRTSLIAGFPGESEHDFQETLDLIREVRFERLGVFTWSPEEDTPAFGLEGRVPEEEMERRAAEALAVQRDIVLEINGSLIGEVVEVMVDEPLEDLPPFSWLGRTRGDAPEVDQGIYLEGPGGGVPAPDFKPGDIVRAEVVGHIDFDLEGVIVRG